MPTLKQISYWESMKGMAGPFKGKKHSEESRKLMSETLRGRTSPNKGKTLHWMIGEKNPNWKGDDVSYKCLHDWVTAHKGKPDKCSNTKCVYPRLDARGYWLEKPSRFEWASISKKAKRDLADYFSLCTSCHRQYDIGTKNALDLTVLEDEIKTHQKV